MIIHGPDINWFCYITTAQEWFKGKLTLFLSLSLFLASTSFAHPNVLFDISLFDSRKGLSAVYCPVDTNNYFIALSY